MPRGNDTMTWIEAVRGQRSFDYSMSATPRTSNVSSGSPLPGGDARMSISSSTSSPPRSRPAQNRPSSATTSTACSSRASRRYGVVPPPSAPPPPLPLPDLPAGAVPKSATVLHHTGKGKERQRDSLDETVDGKGIGHESKASQASGLNTQPRSTSNDSNSTVLGFAHNATPSTTYESAGSADSAQRRRPHLKVLMKLAPPSIAANAAAAAAGGAGTTTSTDSKNNKAKTKTKASRADDQSESTNSTRARSPPPPAQDSLLSTLAGLG